MLKIIQEVVIVGAIFRTCWSATTNAPYAVNKYGTSLDTIESDSYDSVLSWLQSQSSEVSSAQNSVRLVLHNKKIPVGAPPRSMKTYTNRTASGIKVALSSDDNNIECRISLGRVALGRKAVAPCGCTGSQEWVQFSELNKMRRRDPSHWIICQTCQKKFEYASYQIYGGLSGNLVSAVLDRRVLIRGSTAFITLILLFATKGLLLRFLTSRLLWQQYPTWGRFVHMPIVLLFWAGRIAAGYISGYYMMWEKALVDYLADVETSLIESHLPVTMIEVAGESEQSQ